MLESNHFLVISKKDYGTTKKITPMTTSSFRRGVSDCHPRSMGRKTAGSQGWQR